MRIAFFACVGCVVGAALVACATKSSGGGGGGSSSSGSSSGAPSGVTTCSPTLDAGFLESGNHTSDYTVPEAPCPAGTRAVASQDLGATGLAPGPAEVFKSDSELASSRYCAAVDGGAGDAGADADTDAGTDAEAGAGDDAGAGVDFATHDVWAIRFLGFSAGTAPPLTDVGGELWISRNNTWCGGARPGTWPAFYVVPKGKVLNVEDCQTSCGGSLAP